MAFIEAKDYRFFYPDEVEPAVFVEQMEIKQGTITLLVGPSGCGKTTFLKTLNRMVEEEGGYLSGTITLEGTDIKSLPKEKLRRRVGMVFQQPIAFPHLSLIHI